MFLPNFHKCAPSKAASAVPSSSQSGRAVRNVLLEGGGGSRVGLAAAQTVQEITAALVQVLIFHPLTSGMCESSRVWSSVHARCLQPAAL